VDITIITGFLGSGKTTTILSVVDRMIMLTGMKIVVIQNDFGKIGIDAKLLKIKGLTVQEMPSGCICCTLGEDFLDTLNTVVENVNPDLIIVEPSGVADPSNILSALKETKAPPVGKIKTIAILDAVRFKKILDAFPNPTKTQVGVADCIIINKTDESDQIGVDGILDFLEKQGVSVPVIATSAVNGTNLDRVVEVLVSP